MRWPFSNFGRYFSMFDKCKCSCSLSSFGLWLGPASFVSIRFIHSDIVLKLRPRTKTNILALTLTDIFRRKRNTFNEFLIYSYRQQRLNSQPILWLFILAEMQVKIINESSFHLQNGRPEKIWNFCILYGSKNIQALTKWKILQTRKE